MMKLAGSGESGSITNPVLSDDLQSILRNEGPASFFTKFIPPLIGLGFVVGIIIFFFMFVLGAIQWISSGGDKAALEGARGKISNALVGLIVLFLVFAIVTLIEQFFGTNILTLDLGPLRIE